jgi:hypothetical protein
VRSPFSLSGESRPVLKVARKPAFASNDGCSLSDANSASQEHHRCRDLARLAELHRLCAAIATIFPARLA